MKQPMRTQAQKTTRAMRVVGLWAGDQSEMVATGVAGEALVELGGGEDAAQKGGEADADGGEDDDGEQEGDETGEEAGELDEHPVSGLAKREFDLLPHGVFSRVVRSYVLTQVSGLQVLAVYGLKRSGQRQRDTR